MSHLPVLLRTAPSIALRQSLRVRFKSAPSYQPPGPPHGDNPHRAFYKSWGVPVAKVFLGALFTYQVLYWSWLKLDGLETKRENGGEIRRLEAQLSALTKDATGKD